jgi:hypothetical protein
MYTFLYNYNSITNRINYNRIWRCAANLDVQLVICSVIIMYKPCQNQLNSTIGGYGNFNISRLLDQSNLSTRRWRLISWVECSVGGYLVLAKTRLFGFGKDYTLQIFFVRLSEFENFILRKPTLINVTTCRNEPSN